MQRYAHWSALLSFGCLLLACSDEQGTAMPDSGGGGGSADGDGGEASWIVQGGTGGCNSVLYAPPDRGGSHIEQCSPIDHLSNPPTSGDHYPIWADFGTYDTPVPRGFYLHSMEHGAVVLAYRCSSGCDTEVAAMQGLVDALPDDPDCGGSPRLRLIITPDPELDVPFAAAAWGHMLKAECFDADLVGAFVEQHYNRGPEDVCGPGFDPTDPSSNVPADCGD